MSLHRCFLFIALVVVLSGCAKKVAPDGGPKDVTPATLIGTEPPTGSTNVTSTRIRFVFDDYVDRSVRSAFAVMPTVRFTTSYAGDVVDVEFVDTLAPNTTYVVTLGTEFKDIRGNTPLQSESVVFSTGADIDTGRITGTVEDRSPTGLVIFAYPHAELLDSTFSPAQNIPPYRLPVGSSGMFTLNGLADGTYRVMAVRDANKNGIADASEAFAMATHDVVVSNGVARRVLLRVGAAKDVLPPEPVTARALSNTSVQVTFSEAVHIIPTTGAPFTITDSSGARIEVGAWFQSRASGERLIVRLRDTLSASTYNLVVAPGSFADSIGLLVADTARKLTFRGTVTRDTTTLRVVAVTPPDSSLLAPDSVIVVSFSDAVDAIDNIGQNIVASEPKIASATWDGPTRLVLRPSGLTRTEWHRLNIPLKGLRNVQQTSMLDTSVVRVLKATERVDPGAIQGVVADSAGFGQPMLLRVLSSQNAVIRTQYVTSGLPFKIDSLPAGEISFDVIHDVNNNGQYDHGSVKPYMPAEAFYVFRTRVVVRARWTIEDVKLVILP